MVAPAQNSNMHVMDHPEFPLIAFMVVEPESALKEEPVQIGDQVVCVNNVTVDYIKMGYGFEQIKKVARLLLEGTPNRCLWFEAFSAPDKKTDQGSVHVPDAWLE